MRAGNLEIIAGPCQFLPAMSEDRRSFAWTGENIAIPRTFTLSEAHVII